MSNPKDKARQLVNNFIKYSESGIDNNVKTLKANAKKCSLIAVNEILDILHPNNWKVEIDMYYYWRDVKEEIQNL